MKQYDMQSATAVMIQESDFLLKNPEAVTTGRSVIQRYDV
jgi:hypothetical protein